jgi:uncharacterized membrane protein
MEEYFTLLGAILILLGIVLFSIGLFNPKSRVESGGLILIGPVPIAWGSSKDILLFTLLIGLALLLFLMLVVKVYKIL